MELSVLNKEGKETGRKVTLNDQIFGIEPSDHAIYLDVKQYLANQRQGTSKSKERGEVSGSTRKIKKQKGTGSARAGSIKSPVFRGGGTIFGPRPRNYHFKLNVKLKRLARKSAFAFKAKSDSLMVIQDLNMEAKTKDFKALLSSMKLENQKVLFILGDKTDSVYLAARNLGRVKVVTADSFNTYDVLNASKVILAESSIEKIQTILN